MTKQPAFLIISSSSRSLKNIAQNFTPLVLAESPLLSRDMVFLPYFHRFPYNYLTLSAEPSCLDTWKTKASDKGTILCLLISIVYYPIS